MFAALMLLVSLAMGAVSILIFGRAATVFQEIEGGVLFVAATVLFSGAFIVNSVDVAGHRIKKSVEELGKKTDRLAAQLRSDRTPTSGGQWPTITNE